MLAKRAPVKDGESARRPLEAVKKVGKGRVAANFDLGQGASEAAIPFVLSERATPAKVKSRATLWARAEKAIWRRCGSVTDRIGYAPSPRHHHMAFSVRARPFPTFFTASYFPAVWIWEVRRHCFWPGSKRNVTCQSERLLLPSAGNRVHGSKTEASVPFDKVTRSGS